MNKKLKIVDRDRAKELKLKRFFTGEKCIRGHICERYTSVGSCVCCIRNKRDEWAKKNSKWLTAYNKKRNSRPEQKELHRNQVRDWTRKNKVKLKNKRAENYKNNFSFRQAHIKRNITYFRSIRRNQPFKAYLMSLVMNHNRRFKKRGIGGKIILKQLMALFESQKGKCKICKDKIEHGYISYDHIMPIKLGGNNDISNGQFVCPPCNMMKGGKHPDEFKKQMRDGSTFIDGEK